MSTEALRLVALSGDTNRRRYDANSVSGALPDFWPMRDFGQLIPSYASDVEKKKALVALLDRAAELFECGDWQQGMQLQHHVMKNGIESLSRSAWREFAGQDCIDHPVRELVHQDPFTRRSFTKPRGYAGDAVLIDFIYGVPHPEHDLENATELGRWVCNYASNTMAPRGVRRRMHLFSELIDRTATQRRDARVLSVASGHMREMLLSHAIRNGVTGEIYAFDQDEKSLAEVEATAPSRNVKAVKGSVRRLLVGRHDFQDFDLVYAAGLFDYLDGRAGQRLATEMFAMLRPGGTLAIANFLPGIYDVGYMESFMGWDLVYRTRREICALVAEIDVPYNNVRYFEENEGNVGFVLVTKPER